MYCGKNPAEGYASIYKDGVEKWYCHGDDDFTCYERKSIELAVGSFKSISPYDL